tara:strand:- start:638 stop:742 length:105 start_codon:yes stop_codon:yes gene_type:complete
MEEIEKKMGLSKALSLKDDLQMTQEIITSIIIQL